MKTITSIQFQRAIALAGQHGHLWGAASPEPWEPDSEEVAALRRELAAALAGGSVSLLQIERLTEAACGSDDRIGGIYCPTVDEAGVVRHVTCTGRVSWAIYFDGSVELEVSRPIPQGVKRRREVDARIRGAQAVIEDLDARIERGRPLDEIAHEPRWEDYAAGRSGPIHELAVPWRKWVQAERDHDRCSGLTPFLSSTPRDLFLPAVQRTRAALRETAERLIGRLRTELPDDSRLVLRARVDRRGRATVQRLGDAHARHVEALADCLRALGVDDATVLAEARRACPDAADAADDAERLLADCEHGCDREQVARYAQLWRAAARTAQADGRAA